MTKVRNIPLYMFFMYFNFIFYFYDVMLRYTKMFCVDIGPSRRAGASPLEMRGVVILSISYVVLLNYTLHSCLMH